MPPNPAIKAVMAQINKKRAGTVMFGSEIQAPLRETVTTGSLNIDAALGGGWATNHWNEIVGNPSAGKTMVVQKTIAANQALDEDFTVAWFASEDFHVPYAEMAGCDMSRIVVIEDNAMETVYEDALKFLEPRAVDMIVIDSLPALAPIRELDKTMEDFQPGLAANLTGKFLRMSSPYIKRPLVGDVRPVTGIIVNQWRNKIGGYGDPRTTPGGMAKDFFCFQRVEVRRDEWINNTRGRHVGQTINVRNMKNKLAPPGREGFIDAYFAAANGFEPGEYDLTKDMISAALAYDVIVPGEKRGQWLFGDLSWPNRPKLDAAITGDPELQFMIREAVILAISLPDVEEVDDGSEA